MSDGELRHAVACVKWNQKSLAPVRRAQAVFMVVADGGPARRQDTGKRAVQRRWHGGAIQLARVNRLTVLGANPVGNECDVREGNDLRQRQQATDGRTSPAPRFQGSCSQGKGEPTHTLVLTPG
jgi:hypothetical protein